MEFWIGFWQILGLGILGEIWDPGIGNLGKFGQNLGDFGVKLVDFASNLGDFR